MHNLRQFLDIPQRGGELVRVETPVSSDLEIAETHRRVIAAAGPALLFENVEGADFPCVTNLFGTKKRVDLAFGSRPEQFIKQLVQLAQDLPSLSPNKIWPHKNLVSAALKLGMKTSAKGPITQHVQTPPDLSRLPFLKTWPEDGGQLNLTKFLVVVDCPMDLGDFRQVLAYALARAQLQTDLFIIANLAMDTLDYTGPEINKGSKGILIGVGEPVRNLPHEFRGDLPHGANAAAVYCAGALAVQGPTYGPRPRLRTAPRRPPRRHRLAAGLSHRRRRCRPQKHQLPLEHLHEIRTRRRYRIASALPLLYAASSLGLPHETRLPGRAYHR